jgi:hypothetical protein
LVNAGDDDARTIGQRLREIHYARRKSLAVVAGRCQLAVAGMIVGWFGGEERLGLVGIEAPSYRGFRYPLEIISHCVWLYHRFPLSFREVQEMMAQREIIVSPETIRQWCAKAGQSSANALRRRQARPAARLVYRSKRAAATPRVTQCQADRNPWPRSIH